MIPDPLPDHSTDEYKNSVAGHGQPLHVEEYGQTYYLDPSVPGGVATDETSLHPGKYLLGLTLNRIYKLLSKMIESLQNVAVQQAARLEILADWQAAYNSKKNSIHSFVQGNGDAFGIGDNDPDRNTLRSDLNNSNTNYSEQLRSNSNIVGDDAKQLQTMINQTQDAVNKQANMATSLVQQFSTILSSIFR